MPGDFLDLVLIALAMAFAVAGYRQGFIIGVLSFVGFTGGAILGIYFAPGLAMMAASQGWRALSPLKSSRFSASAPARDR